MADFGLANVPTLGDRIPNNIGIATDRFVGSQPSLAAGTDVYMQNQGGGGIRFKIRKEGEWVDVS